MKITKSEVRTLYNIDVTFNDFAELFSRAKEDIRLDGEFTDFNLDDTSVGNIRDCFENLHNAKDINYIVRKLGFDGASNYGYYHKRKGVYTLVVYDNGDTLNDEYNIDRKRGI